MTAILTAASGNAERPRGSNRGRAQHTSSPEANIYTFPELHDTAPVTYQAVSPLGNVFPRVRASAARTAHFRR
ncbi:hypothetical protein GCM10018773_36390 [Streptomyces candidus]|nr:hypothetical protein GCM10018773_36390 [Streptomyces candidus]